MFLKIFVTFVLLTKHDIITQISYSKEYADIARRITGGHDIHKDLFQEFIIVLFGMDDEKIISLHEKNELRYFSVGVMRKMLMPKDVFYKNHKIRDYVDSGSLEIKEDIESNLEVPGEMEIILKTPAKKLMKHKHFGFEKAILKLSVDLGSAIAVSKKTGIPHPVIKKAVSRIKNDLKKKYGKI